MARASISTWLGLDTWAEILTINPLFFNSLYLTELVTSESCLQIWSQYSYQNPLNVSREDVALAIYTAERNIAGFLGFNLLPDWTCEEEHRLTRARVPEGYPVSRNVRGQPKSVTALNKRVISGGVRGLELIAGNTLIQREDLDGDGYDETASVRFSCPWPVDPDDPPPCDPQPILFNTCQLRVYYPGHGGDREWEIKPTKIVYDGSLVIVYFKSWQIVDEQYTLGGFDPELRHGLNAATDANYLTGVDLYREYNDLSQQATLVWGNPLCAMCGGIGCITCVESQSAGCLTVRDPRLGILAYTPALWNDELNHWDTICEPAIAPGKAIINYYSGLQQQCACPLNRMASNIERAIAVYAAALLPRDACDCNNAEAHINYWREDLAESGEGLTGHSLTQVDLTNPFGTLRGAVEAYRIVTADNSLRVTR